MFPSYPYTIISGDFNAHHSIWGCHNDDAVGISLLESSYKYDFQILNNKSSTFLSRPGLNLSSIDLTFVSPALFLLASWFVGEDNFDSDHLPTHITIGSKLIKIPRFSTRLRSPSLNWLSFIQTISGCFNTLDQSFISLQSHTSPLTNFDSLPLPLKYDYLVEAIVFSIEKVQNCKPTSSSYNKRLFNKAHPPAPWWNSSCQEVLEERKKAIRAYRIDPSQNNYINLKKQEAKAKKTFKQAKRTAWKEYCFTINPRTPISKLWTFVKRFKNRFLQSFTSASSTNSSNDLFPLLHNICPPSCLHLLPPSQLDSNINSNFPTQPFTQKELAIVLKKLNLRASPGLDRVDSLTFSKLPPFILKQIVTMFNEMIQSNYIPQAWLTSLTFFIPKSSPGKYRPISLTSSILKVMESLILLRLDWWVEKNKFIPDYQYGFRKGRACNNNLAIFVTEIQTGFLKNQFTACLFIDISNAFDNVFPDILTKELLSLGLLATYAKLIYGLISERTVKFAINGSLSQPYTFQRRPSRLYLKPYSF